MLQWLFCFYICQMPEKLIVESGEKKERFRWIPKPLSGVKKSNDSID